MLTAKLYNLDSVRGSPEPLEEYENPSSMETQVRWLSVVRNTILEIKLDTVGTGRAKDDFSTLKSV